MPCRGTFAITGVNVHVRLALNGVCCPDMYKYVLDQVQVIELKEKRETCISCAIELAKAACFCSSCGERQNGGRRCPKKLLET